MINISPAARIVLGLLLVQVGLLILGGMTGLIPDELRVIDAQRRTLTNSLALQYSLAAEHGDPSNLEKVMRLIVAQNPEILSIELDPADGKPLPRAGTQATSRKDRSVSQPDPSYLKAPVYRDNRPWGTLVVRFTDIARRRSCKPSGKLQQASSYFVPSANSCGNGFSIMSHS